MARKRLKASHRVDASDRLVCTHRSIRYRAEGHFAVGLLQLAKCSCAVFKLDHGLLGWGSIYSDFFLSFGRRDGSRPIWGVRQSARFTGYQDGVSHCLRAQPHGARIFRPAGR